MPKKKTFVEIEKGKTPWEKLSKRLLVRWLTVAHLPEYQQFCEDFSDLFVEDIFQYDLAGVEVQARHDVFCEKYRLNNVWHHQTNFESDEDIINYGVFQDGLAVEPIYHEDAANLTLVKNGRVYLSVCIGEKFTEEQITGEVQDIVAEARAEKGITPLRGKSLAGPTVEDFKIYDAVKNGLPHLDIIKKFWPEKYRKIRSLKGIGNETESLEMLRAKFIKDGKSELDAEELAWQSLYGSDPENPVSPQRETRKKYNQLMMRIYDARKRAHKALNGA